MKKTDVWVELRNGRRGRVWLDDDPKTSYPIAMSEPDEEEPTMWFRPDGSACFEELGKESQWDILRIVR